MRTYDIRSGHLLNDNLTSAITCVSLSGDDNCVLCSHMDGALRLIDKENGELLNTYYGHKNKNFKVESCLSNSDAVVISGSEDGMLWFWELVEVLYYYNHRAIMLRKFKHTKTY